MKIHASINRMMNNENSAVKAYASVTMDGMFAGRTFEKSLDLQEKV